MTPTAAGPPSYDSLLETGRRLYPGIAIGRPGRSRGYWATIWALRALRAGLRVDVEGAANLRPGAGILVANHVSALDPLVVVMSGWWRVTAFTKLEWFQSRGGPFFRLMGQIPLRRGDAASTDWAIAMASSALAFGGKVGLYPEGTRSPDPAVLHKLHGRVLMPVLHAHPDVPVHAVTTTYARGARRRRQVMVRISPPLRLDVSTMEQEQVIAVVREALLAQGGQTYLDVSAHEAKQGRTAPPQG